MLKIIPYNEKYIEQVFDFVGKFYIEAKLEETFKIEFNALTTIEGIMKAGQYGYVFIDGYECVGCIGGLKVEPGYSSDPVWQEVFWYMKPKYRTQASMIHKAVQQKLYDRGIKLMVMALTHSYKGDKIGRLYERLGFKPMETHYIKELSYGSKERTNTNDIKSNEERNTTSDREVYAETH